MPPRGQRREQRKSCWAGSTRHWWRNWVPAKIGLIARRLAEMADLPHVARTRQCGMMVGIDLAAADGEPFDPNDRVGATVCHAARDRGIIVRPLGDTVVLMPAPAMDLDTLDALLVGVNDTIAEGI